LLMKRNGPRDWFRSKRLRTPRPPAADDEAAYIFVDHREEEASIVASVSERLAPADALATRDDETLFVTFRGQEQRIPLTMSPHDRYVAVSSLAELLKDDYRFFVLVPSLESDTHGLLVAPRSVAKKWDPLPEHLAPLQLGFDYFGQIQVPYLHHEDSAPDFARESEFQREASGAYAQLLEAMLFKRNIDSATAAAFAKFMMREPKAKEEFGLSPDASEAEVTAKIKAEFEAALQDAKADGAFEEFDSAMQKLWKLTGRSPK
jgi:hypothetical protein